MKALLPYLKLFKKQWLMMAIGLLLSTIALLAGIGLLSLSGWFLSATAIAGLSILATQGFNYYTPAGGVRFLSIVRTASRYGERYTTHQATFKLLTELRVWVWRRILPLSAANLHNKRFADLLNRLVSDIDTLDHLYLRLLTPLFSAAITLVVMYLFLAYFDTQLALILCLSLLLLWLALPVLFYYLGKKPGIQQLHFTRLYRIQLLSMLQGMAELSLFNAKQSFRHTLDESEQALIKTQQSMANIMAFSQALLVLCHGIIVVIVLYLATSGVGDYQPPGALLAMVGFMALASVEMLLPISGAFQHLSGCVTAAKRVNELVEQTPDILFNEQSQQSIKSGDLLLTNINFSYPAQEGHSRQILKDISLTIKAGEKVALLGKTGCGKSTLLSLITREWQAQQGQITIAGQPIEHYSQAALRKGISVVSQRVYLFSGTLRDNLTLAQPDYAKTGYQNRAEQVAAEQENDKQLLQVLNKVGLSQLTHTDNALDTWIGEGGRQLSGGEQRRIGVARLLLQNAPILLLDEPTEGLDKQTEAEILKLLFDFARDKTLLMISHRLTAMQLMDTIYLMQEGQIRSAGNHQQLLKEDAYYASLYQTL